MIRAVLALIAIACVSPTSAGAIECRRASTPAEHAICNDPTLRAADAALSGHYETVRGALIDKSVSRQLAKSQRAWLALRDAGCAAAACLRPRIEARDAILTALAAQVSESNPTLFDLHAVWLEGPWVAGKLEPAGLKGSSDLPGENQHIIFKAGELCDGPGACSPFGLNAQKLGAGAGHKRLPEQLGLSPDAPRFLTFIFGKANYELVPMQDGTLLALATGCPVGNGPCTDVKQVWRPLGADSRVHEADLSKE